MKKIPIILYFFGSIYSPYAIHATILGERTPKKENEVVLHADHLCYACKERLLAALKAVAKTDRIQIEDQADSLLFVIERRCVRKSRVFSWVEATHFPVKKISRIHYKRSGKKKERILFERKTIRVIASPQRTPLVQVCAMCKRRTMSRVNAERALTTEPMQVPFHREKTQQPTRMALPK